MDEWESSGDEEFCIRPPPPSDAIREILKRYPDGQVFKEIIQNADDANASTVHFYVDHRHHPTTNLLKRKLADYQGPSLIAYNDAPFTKEDWKSIQNMQRSVKADDPFKVGKFGIGFNSIYHLTDFPMIVSGKKVAFFEPQEIVWKDSGKSKSLEKMQRDYRSHMVPLHGIGNFKASSEMIKYDHTLFRFPLRTVANGMSKNTWNVDKLLRHIDVLKQEAEVLLLFLRSVKSVKVYEISGRGLSLLFKVKAECSDDLQSKTFKKKLDHAFSKDRDYGVKSPISSTSHLCVNFETRTIAATNLWVVSNWVGCSDKKVRKVANEECVFPWVGTALKIGSEITNGRLFCTLPMPTEVRTGLPVHVNGTFSLTDNRRAIKWPQEESTNDSTEKWNTLLIEKVIPPCYALLLETARSLLQGEKFYDYLPDVQELKDSHWEPLLGPLFTAVFETECLWSSRQEWIAINSAIFVSEEEPAEDSIQEILTTCGYNVVALPPNMWRAFEVAGISINERMLTPSLVRSVLQSSRSCYDKRDRYEKLELLEFCLKDEDYHDLHGLYLLPLANGNFECFDVYEEKEDFVRYICDEELSYQVLPNVEQFLIGVQDQPLHAMLVDMAESGQTQVKKLDARGVSNLLEHVFPEEWRGKNEVSVLHTPFSLDWFKTFWEWVEDKNLEVFTGKLIVPMVCDANGITSVTALQRESGIICIQKNETLTNELEGCFNKLAIRYTRCKYLHYLKHEDINLFLNPFTPEGVLKAFNYSTCGTLSRQEACSFQQFLMSHGSNGISRGLRPKLLKIPMFLTADGSSSPVSLSPALTTKFIVEPRCFRVLRGITDLLPPKLVILSCNGNNEILLKLASLHSCISFPSSTARVLINYIFPQIRKCAMSNSQITTLMQKVLDAFNHLVSYEPSISREIGDLEFLMCETSSSKLYSPKDLYDPTVNELKDLFKGQCVFPTNFYQYLPFLKKCGLRSTVNAQSLYNILEEVGGSIAGEVGFSRVKAVFAYIQKHAEKLDEPIIFKSFLTVSKYSRSPVFGTKISLKRALHKLAGNRSILPIEQMPPESCSYPVCLPWKGSNSSFYLTKMNDSVLPCSPDTINTFSSIAGTQMYMVVCPPDLCSSLRLEPPIDKVVDHLLTLHEYDSLGNDLDSMVIEIYSYLGDHISDLKQERFRLSYFKLKNGRWVWLNQTFVSPTDVAFKHHPRNSHLQLSPYLHVLTPQYKFLWQLFREFGAHDEVTDELLVSVLERMSQSGTSDWEIILAILNWVTNYGNSPASNIIDLGSLYVPVESKFKSLEFAKVTDVAYVDNKFLNRHKYKSQHLMIHSSVDHLASKLGATPLSVLCGMSSDKFQDIGQSEDHIHRLQTILQCYEGGLTIIKELIQNADDAGAEKVEICYDSRHHVTDEDDLPFPGMAEAHGPALLFWNNKTFSKSDFENILRLAGETKKDEPLKIGKFGLGFCSVYHLTDIPSFVSGSKLYIFDPTLSFLADVIDDYTKRGKSLLYTKFQSSQMEPFRGLFNFRDDKPYDHTIFRFPFRNSFSSRNISPSKYGEREVNQLMAEVEEAGSKLLLFLKNVKRISFSRIDEGKTQPIQLLTVSKEVANLDRQCSIEPASLSKPFSCKQEVSATKVTTKVVKKQSHGILTTNQHWLMAECVSTELIGAVACKLECCQKKYRPGSVTGEVFCFLPLHLETGLPVHVSANFAVMNDRRGIHYSDSSSKSKESQQNISLMKDTIPKAYHMLLIVLRELCQQQKVDIATYEFSSFWPTSEMLKTKNPWDYFISEFYNLLSKSKLFYSWSLKEWQYLHDSNLLSHGILKFDSKDPNPEAEKVLQALKFPLLRLSSNYHHSCMQNIVSKCTIGEEKFLSIFFEKISRVPFQTRNKILFDLMTVSGNICSDYRQKSIENNRCIPCTPDGKKLKYCREVVDRNSKIGGLFDPEDGVFPIQGFDEARTAMLKFGMISEDIPCGMIVERAHTVQKLHKAKALKRVELLISCIQWRLDNDKKLPLELTEVPFLPVLQRPPSYPKDLKWVQSSTFSCGSMLLANTNEMISLVGSFARIVSSTLGGHGHISDSVLKALKISFTPFTAHVVEQLLHIQKMHLSTTKPHTKWITEACQVIYKHLSNNMDLAVKKSLCGHPSGLVWTGSAFIHHEKIAKKWLHDGPLLYSLPPLLKLPGMEYLVEALEIKDEFDKEQLLNALTELGKKYCGKHLETREEEETVLAIVSKLSAILDDDERLDEENVYYLPDNDRCMQKVQDLAYDDLADEDSPGCEMEAGVHLLHRRILVADARKFWVRSARSRALDHYGSDFGEDFGQSEELTQRIKNILEAYTHSAHDVTVLKELLQNADDAGAKKLYFILDKRHHTIDRMWTDDWKDLQGPAFLVWNDKGFTDVDFEGIQSLGCSTKKGKDNIGQYGIGFNVVYHLTDCPSFYTNGKTLCILDPHHRYIPRERNKAKPGRKLDNLDSKFWNNWPGLKSVYLQEGLNNCPKEMRKGGTLFRFPLRHTKELTRKSSLVDEENSDTAVLTATILEAYLHNWAPTLKEALLFVKNVTELRFFVIDDDNSMKTTYHFKAEMDLRKRIEVQTKSKTYPSKDNTVDPFVVTYELKLAQKVPPKQDEEWLVQQGMGDLHKKSESWNFLKRIKPQHGIATRTDGQEFTPMIFCFLPLHLQSKLPVHVNGNFILDSSSRSTLWLSRNTQGHHDDQSLWNHKLIEALGRSYVFFLAECQKRLVKSKYFNPKNLNAAIEKFYSIFPKWKISSSPEGEMLELARLTYKYMKEYGSKMLVTVNKLSHSTHSIEWQPVLNSDQSKQVYFWPKAEEESSSEQKDTTSTDNAADQSEGQASVSSTSVVSHAAKCEKTVKNRKVIPVLKQIGILLCAAPDWVREHFSEVDIDIPEAKPEAVFQYFTNFHSKLISETQSYPCEISETAFKSVKLFKTFVKYVKKLEFCNTEEKDHPSLCAVFPEPPYELPLLLTADRILRKFSKEEKVIASALSQVISTEVKSIQSRNQFLHPEMFQLNFSPEYFLEPSSKNWKLVREILGTLLNEKLCEPRVKFCDSFINIKETLAPLWRCMRHDPVFKVHAEEIVKEWALIMSVNCELFLYKPGNTCLLPMAEPQKQKAKEGDDDIEIATEEYTLFEILKSNKMPVADEVVVEPEQFCPNFDNPESILANFYHLYIEQKLLLHAQSIYDHIEELFKYFGKIKFDEASLRHIKSLPLFQNVDGEYCCLKGDIYLWPDHINMAGMKKILNRTSTVFLTCKGPWKALASADTIGIKPLHPLVFHVKFVFHHFSLLTNKEKVQQIQHIRDTDGLFNVASEYSKLDSDKNLKSVGESFIAALKNAAFIEREENGKVDLLPASEFCVPIKDKDSIFEMFPRHYTILPCEFHDAAWLDFLKKIGLKTAPTKDEFRQFCYMISRGDHQQIEKTSKLLLECLFSQYEWHDDKDFLHEISGIPFVCPDSLENLSWMVPASTAKVSNVNGVNLTCLKGSALHTQPRRWNKQSPHVVAKLVWSELPVISLPKIEHPPPPPTLTKSFIDKTKIEESFLDRLGICSKPDLPLVIRNLRNLSKSRFSSAALFENYPSQYIKGKKLPLVDTVHAILNYLHMNDGRHSDLSFPCIPVNAANNCGNISKPVLVKPIQVIFPLQEDLQSSLHPYLFNLPDQFKKFQEMLAVNIAAMPENLFHALQLIHSKHDKTPLTERRKHSVQKLLKLLYDHYQPKSEQDHTYPNEPLYLPTPEGILSQSTNLIFNDKRYYKQEEFDFSCTEFSLLSLLCNRHSEINDYGFQMSQFVSVLPDRHSPLSLSRCCLDQLSENSFQLFEPSALAVDLKSAFQTENIDEIVEVIISSKSPLDVCKKFTVSLKKILNAIGVYTFEDLQVDIQFQHHSQPKCNIGTAHVNFLLQEIHASGHYVLCVDSKATSFGYKVMDDLTECIANEAFRLSGVDKAALQNSEHAIHLALQVRTDKELNAIFADLGIRYPPGLKLIRAPDPDEFAPAVKSIKLAKVWIEQAKYDLQAVEAMLEAAESNEKLSAQACFLAHQVAEKAVKAGMYATIGLTDEELKSHDLAPLAGSLMNTDSTLRDLPELVRLVSKSPNYYLRPRYPNRCNDCAPSTVLTVEEARDAVDICNKIYGKLSNTLQ